MEGNAAETPHLMSVAYFCRTHTMAPSTLYKLIAAGEGPALTRIGRRTYISQESAAAWRAANTLSAGQAHQGRELPA